MLVSRFSRISASSHFEQAENCLVIFQVMWAWQAKKITCAFRYKRGFGRLVKQLTTTAKYIVGRIRVHYPATPTVFFRCHAFLHNELHKSVALVIQCKCFRCEIIAFTWSTRNKNISMSSCYARRQRRICQSNTFIFSVVVLCNINVARYDAIHGDDCLLLCELRRRPSS